MYLVYFVTKTECFKVIHVMEEFALYGNQLHCNNQSTNQSINIILKSCLIFGVSYWEIPVS